MPLEQIFQQIQKNKFWRDREIIGLAVESAVLNLITWLYILMNFLGTKGAAVLHNNVLSGSITGNWQKLLIYPLLGLGVLLINFVLIFRFYLLRRKNLINLLAFGLLFVQIVCFISVLLIINF